MNVKNGNQMIVFKFRWYDELYNKHDESIMRCTLNKSKHCDENVLIFFSHENMHVFGWLRRAKTLNVLNTNSKKAKTERFTASKICMYMKLLTQEMLSY